MPLVKESHIKKKRDFDKYIIDEEIPYKNIFFTDEKKFFDKFRPKSSK